ncbi:ferredoxin [Arthrobacter sp. Soil761]|nr:ferredoxin [Arthrobacter sp. Soil761]
MKVILEQDKCVASGQCVTAAGAVFDQRDEDGIAILLKEHPPLGLEAEVRQAAAVCPVLAIHVTTDN